MCAVQLTGVRKLFGEPLSNLDAAPWVEMRSQITRLHHDLKATMIFVTHDQV